MRKLLSLFFLLSCSAFAADGAKSLPVDAKELIEQELDKYEYRSPEVDDFHLYHGLYEEERIRIYFILFPDASKKLPLKDEERTETLNQIDAIFKIYALPVFIEPWHFGLRLRDRNEPRRLNLHEWKWERFKKQKLLDATDKESLKRAKLETLQEQN